MVLAYKIIAKKKNDQKKDTLRERREREREKERKLCYTAMPCDAIMSEGVKKFDESELGTNFDLELMGPRDGCTAARSPCFFVHTLLFRRMK